MIAFVNVEDMNVYIYNDNGVHIIPFNEIDDIYEIAGDKDIKYVTDVLETTADEIYNTVKNNFSEEISQLGEMGIDDSRDNKYIRSTSKGVLHISDAGISFQGQGDCKLIDGHMYKIINNSPVIQSMIKNKKLEIIGYSQMRKAIREANKELDKIEELKKEQERRSIDSIIVKDGISAEELAGRMFQDGDDDFAEHIDLG